jgi:hypothetical protein
VSQDTGSDARDELAILLLRWFKHEFFSWVTLFSAAVLKLSHTSMIFVEYVTVAIAAHSYLLRKDDYYASLHALRR